MKKLIYGLLAFAIMAVVATTASSAPDPNLEPCLFAEAQVFEKLNPGTGGVEYMYWDNEDNYLGKERLDGNGQCVFDSYDGTCVENEPLCNM